jgi:hypothetical protein
VVLLSHVVVVAVDRFGRQLERLHAVRERLQHGVHHLAAVFQRVVLRPVNRLDVFAEIVGVLRKYARSPSGSVMKSAPCAFSRAR